jgi:CDP-paratose 2-epimerase
MLDYAHMFGIRTVVFRYSSIFGGRQFSTFGQGWIGWFVKQALDIKGRELKEPFTISETGKQVRDVLFASNLITCYFNVVKEIDVTVGQVYNIGVDIANSLSLLELFRLLESMLGIHMGFKRLSVRQSDQKAFIVAIGKVK